MKPFFTCFICSFILLTARAQKSPEFPKGWVLYLQELHGAVTNFTTSPDLFVSSLRLSPQVTVVPGHLRLGGSAAAVFNNKKLEGTFGPNLVVNLLSPNVKNLGTILNIQLQGEYLWGTISNQRLIGGLLNIEIGQVAVIGLSMHRDYVLNDWWFQAGFGYNLLHKKKGLQDPMK
jgi:hypothetical protein